LLHQNQFSELIFTKCKTVNKVNAHAQFDIFFISNFYRLQVCNKISYSSVVNRPGTFLGKAEIIDAFMAEIKM